MFIGNTEKEAVYCNEFWSCFERVIDSIDRTTNVLEAWHRSLNTSSHIAHPNIAMFLQILSNEEQTSKIKITQICSGSHLEISKYNLEKEKKIKTLCENFNLISIDSFYKLMDKFIGIKII